MANWTWAAASCRGTSHERSATRKQDAFSCFRGMGKAGSIAILVSDGAGSASFGGEGASLACRSVGRSLRQHFAVSSEIPAEPDFRTWLDAARDLIAVVSAQRGLPQREFAATLICLVSTGAQTVVAHIGDGCAVLKDVTADRWVAPLWPDHGEYASTTFFVTDDELKLRVTHYERTISAAAVFSDGLERLALDFTATLPFDRFFDGMVMPVSASSTAGRDAVLSEKLKRYLNSALVNERTDDDKTLIIAVNK